MSGTLSRRLISAFLLFHLVAGGASLFKKTAPGAAVRSITAPYERTFGIWQSWGMFGPSPPKGSSWMKAAGLTPDGRELALQPLVGELSLDRVEIHYDRVRKIERNMFDKKNHRLREATAQWLCRRSAEAGEPLVSVRMWKEQVRTPTPQQRQDPEHDVVRKVSSLQTVACP